MPLVAMPLAASAADRPATSGAAQTAERTPHAGENVASADGDFTFRRIAAPAPGASEPRITVQIALAPVRLSPPPPDPVAEKAAAAPGDLADAARLAAAVAALSPGGFEPPGASLADALRAVALRHGSDILGATAGTRVSPALALAVIVTESSGRAGAVSHAGAQGLMQLMPATAARFAVADPFAPRENIRGGVAYLDWLLGEFGGDAVLALAAYNAGEGAVRTARGVPPFPETRAYVPKVVAAWSAARNLCLGLADVCPG